MGGFLLPKQDFEHCKSYVTKLAITGLNRYYGGCHTLWDVYLEVSAGSYVCLMGRNSISKTTLLKCIMGLVALREGIIKIKNGLGVTVLLIEQTLSFARKVADRFYIMDRGRGVAAGAMAQLSEDMVKR